MQNEMESLPLHKPKPKIRKRYFRLKTRNNPPVIEELKEFEDGMTKIIQKVDFETIKCHFQKDLNEHIAYIFVTIIHRSRGGYWSLNIHH